MNFDKLVTLVTFFRICIMPQDNIIHKETEKRAFREVKNDSPEASRSRSHLDIESDFVLILKNKD